VGLRVVFFAFVFEETPAIRKRIQFDHLQQ
jgi:hypothetical protein